MAGWKAETFKRLHIVITPLAGVIRGMDSNSKITSDNQHRDVKAQTYTSSQCKIFKKVLARNCPPGREGSF